MSPTKTLYSWRVLSRADLRQTPLLKREATKLVLGVSLCHCLHTAEAPGVPYPRCTLQGTFFSVIIFNILIQFFNFFFH